LQENKINIVLLWSKYGGSVTSVNDLVMQLDERRFNVIFIYLSGYGVEKNLIEDAGYKVLYLCNKKRIRIFSFPILFKLIKILKEYKIDIIHGHAHKPTVYGTIAAMIAGTPVVFAQVYGLSRTRNLKRKLINLFILKKVSKIITVSEAVREDVLKTNPFVQSDKVVPIGDFIDYRRYADVPLTKPQAKKRLNLSQNSFIFGTVGRLAPTKGQIYLVRAFKKVKEALPSVELIFVGDGRLRNQLEEQAAKTPYVDSIHFLGRRNDVPESLKAMDIFVFPSIAEGLPLALMEAMAAGIPCIASAAGGIPEMIANRETGFLVPPKNDGVLAEAMIKMANLPEKKLAEIRKKAQNRIREVYSHQVVRNRLQKLYEDAFKTLGRNC